MPSELILSLAMGPVGTSPVPRDVIESLTEASVRVGTTGPSGFDLKFAVSTRSSLVAELLPSGFFDPPTRVILSANLRGSVTVLMDGVITHHEMAPSDEPGKSVLSVKGEDLTRMLDLIDLSFFPYPAIPAEGRIALMIAKYAPLYGIVPLVMPSVLLDVSNPLDHIDAQHGTDLAYIKYLADLVGYSFYLQPGPTPGMSLAYWGPMLRAPIPFLPTPDPLVIDWDHRSNVESLSFSFDGFAATQWIVYIQTPTNIVIPIPVPNVNPISPPLGAKQPMPLKIANLTGLEKYGPIKAAGIALGKAAAEANTVVKGQGSLDVLRYGSILPARTLVHVRGAGITYDGQYFIDSVTHTIKPGSYKQSFTLSRNALVAGGGLAGALSFGLSPVQQLAGFAGAAVDSAAAFATDALAANPAAALPLVGPLIPSPPNPLPAGMQQPLSAGRVASLPSSPAI